MKTEERTVSSSVDVSQSSNENAYCSHLPMTSNTPVLGVLFHKAIDIIEKEAKDTEAIITINTPRAR